MLQAFTQEDKLFCNGAEQYQSLDWDLYSNFNDTVHAKVTACLKCSGLCCYVSRDAFDHNGNLLPDTFALYVPTQLNQEQASLLFMQIYNYLTPSYKMAK